MTQPPLTRRLLRFAVILAEVGLLWLSVHLFRIEETLGFGRVAPVLFGGFAIHAWLPRRFRLPFFLAMFLAVAVVVFGAGKAAILTGLGLALLGICHLPLLWGVRAAILLVAGWMLACLRSGWFKAAWAGSLMPFLAAMFMFRVAVYLYDLRSEKAPVSIWQRLAYFFMPPNLIFPLYPVVDFKMFLRTYYDSDEFRICQKGVGWMLLGIMHLLLYRLVYHHLSPAPYEIADFSGVALFAASSYLLYLRISGMFHLIAGLLGLFGFNLPATNHWYLFASSLTDYWRRINIYWTEFLKKLVYFPIVMRLRKRGQTLAMLVAAACSFALSWALHSYQWFWIRGVFPMALVDVLFWGTVGGLVIVNTLFELRKRDLRAASDKGRPFRRALSTALGTAGVFCLMSLLWSIWSSATVGEWLSVMSQARHRPARGLAWVAGILVAFVGLYTLFLYAKARAWIEMPRLGSAGKTAAVGVAALALCGVGFVAERAKRGDAASEVWFTLSENRLNAQDAEGRIRGYYEGLLHSGNAASGQGRMFGAMAEHDIQKPEDWLDLGEANLTRPTRDLRLYELLPSLDVAFKGARLTTNRWGMRNRDCTMEKPPGVYRIAMLGASPEMGSGVNDDETIGARLERLLNRAQGDPSGRGYEVLNFAVGGYGLVQQVTQVEKKVLDFHPDAVFYYSHHFGDAGMVFDQLLKTIRNGIPLPPVLEEIHQDLARMPARNTPLQRRRFRGWWPKVLEWGYGRIVTLCRTHQAVPVWIHVPMPEDKKGVDREIDEASHITARMAGEAGFHTISLGGVYAGEDPKSLMIAGWDNHPNARAHALLAEKLFEALMDSPGLLGASGKQEE